jgi:hypothetical protein
VLFRGQGLGKDETGEVRPLLVAKKDDAKGLGFGSEGAFQPWWTDLYNNVAVNINIDRKRKKKKREEGLKLGKERKADRKDHKDRKSKSKSKSKAKAETL